MASDEGENMSVGEFLRVQSERDELYRALKAVLGHIESFELVRNPSGDGNSDWMLRMTRLVTDLKAAQDIIKKVEELK